MNRVQLADLILGRIKQDEASIIKSYRESSNQIGYFIIDDLLPNKIAEKIYSVFHNKQSYQEKNF